ncbi:MAG: AAA family ATPase [Pseudomonadota bacterium]
MRDTKFTLIPTPRTEQVLRKQFPWVGQRPLMIPSGWIGLVHNTCQEIEAVLCPNNAAEVVEYFFASVRESRLRIFLQLNADFDSEARSTAIKTLLNEVQINCNQVCYICGKEVVDLGQFGNRRSNLQKCDDHEDTDADDDSNVESDSDQSTANVSEVNKVDQTLIDKETNNTDTKIAQKTEIYPRVDDLNQVSIPEDLILELQPIKIQLYDITALRKLSSELNTRYKDRDDISKIKTIISKLIKAGGERILKPMPDKGTLFLNQLQADFPNFIQVIDMLRGFNALSDKDEVLRIPVMLMLGPPGVGKTMFAEALARGMDVPFRVIRMENQQAGAGLVGSADFWSNSKPGIVFDVLTSGECGNPVIVVDEIDKAGSDNRYNPLNGLYSLLESGSAASFHDESLPDICLNASKITWILTANYEQSIPQPILSRAKVFEIPQPNINQSLQVANRIYQLLLNDSASIKARFTNELSHDVTCLLASLTPRKMRLALEIALGRAALAGRDKLLKQDIDVIKKVEERKIGFI